MHDAGNRSSPVPCSCLREPVRRLVAFGSLSFGALVALLLILSVATAGPASAAKAIPTGVVGPGATGNDAAPQWFFTVDPADTAECSLVLSTDPDAFLPCTSPFQSRLAADGPYRFAVREVPSEGAPGTPVSAPYVLDRVAPVITITNDSLSPSASRSPQWGLTAETGQPTNCTVTGPAGTVSSTTCSTGPVIGDLTGRPDGDYVLTAQASDAAGNRTTVSSSPYTLATPPGAPAVITTPPSPSSYAIPSWTFTSDPGTTAECRTIRNGVVGSFASCISPRTRDLTLAADGTYVLEVQLTDAAGNVGPIATASTYVLDRTPPATPQVFGPSGPSPNALPSWTWSPELGAVSQCRLVRSDGFVGVDWTLCAPGGTPAVPSDGTWTLEVRETDNARNPSLVGSSPAYQLVTTAPAPPTVTAPSVTGRDTRPTWSVVAAPGATAECQLLQDSTPLYPWAGCSLPPRTDLTGLPDGTYTLQVRLTDKAGNRSSDGRGSYVLDTQAPAAPIVTGVTPSPGRATQPVFSFTMEGATATCQLTYGTTTGLPVACTSPVALDLAGLPDGAYTLVVRVTDAAGNTGPAGSATYLLDTTAPSAPSFASAPPPIASNHQPLWTISAEPLTTVTCHLVGPGGFRRDVTDCPASYRPVLVADGVYLLTVTATDAAGNTGPSAVSTYRLLGTAPAAAVVLGPTTGSSSTPTFSVSAGGALTCSTSKDGVAIADFGGCGPTYTMDLVGQADGVYGLTARVVDAAGNRTDTTWRYTLDTAAPTVTVTSPSSPSNNRAPIWSLQTTELSATAQCRLLRDGGQILSWASCSSSTYTADLPDAADGSYVLQVRLTDAAGNVGPVATGSPYVLDTLAPGRVGITTPATPYSGPVPVPVWTLTADAGTALTCQLSSPVGGVLQPFRPCTAGQHGEDLGSMGEGTYTLTVRSTDAAGNVGPDSNSTYLYDKTPPAQPVGLTQYGAPSANLAPIFTFVLPEAGGAAACTLTGPTGVSTTVACGSPLTLSLADLQGSWTLQVVAIDPAGNTSTAVSSIYVVDTIVPLAPSVAVRQLVSANHNPHWFALASDGVAQCQLVAAGTAPVAGDWVRCDSAAGFETPVEVPGRYDFFARAVDAAGNTSPLVMIRYVLDPAASAGIDVVAPVGVRDPTPAFLLSGMRPGEPYVCSLTGPGYASATVACEAGAFTPSSPLTVSGTYVLKVTSQDGTTEAFYGFDITPPRAPTFLGPLTASGAAADPHWLWTLSNPADVASVTCQLRRSGSGAVSAMVLLTVDSCRAPVATNLARYGEGTYTWTVVAYDAAGNASAPVVSTYRFDTTAPRAAFVAVPPATGSDRLLAYAFSFAPDVDRSGVTCVLSRDLVVIVRGNCSGGSFTAGLPAGEPDGAYVLRVVFSDLAGNTGQMTSRYLLLTPRTQPGGVVRPPAPNPPPRPTPAPNPPPRPAPAPGPPAADPGPAVRPVSTRPRSGGQPAPGVRTPVGLGIVEVPRGATLSGGGIVRAAPGVGPGGVPGLPGADVVRDTVTATLKKPQLPLALLLVVVLFLLVQNRIDGRDPKLASAPIDGEPDLGFGPAVRRPGDVIR